MRRAFGILMILAGLVGVAAFLFVGFEGKYGMNQFVTAIQRGRLDTNALVVGVPSLAILLWGCVLALKKKKD